MDQSFHYLLMINQSLFQKKMIARLSEIGLTSGQPKILDFLNQHNGCMQKELAFGCQIEQATLTGILERMEEKGLIIRKTKEKNRRSSYVFFTDKGMEYAAKVNCIFKEVEDEVLMGLSEEDKKDLTRIFTKICKNMTALEGKKKKKRNL